MKKGKKKKIRNKMMKNRRRNVDVEKETNKQKDERHEG